MLRIAGGVELGRTEYGGRRPSSPLRKRVSEKRTLFTTCQPSEEKATISAPGASSAEIAGQKARQGAGEKAALLQNGLGDKLAV